ncbi:MAG: M48 family metalloprotease [Candidatus Methanomethylophilaceae archaeon]
MLWRIRTAGMFIFMTLLLMAIGVLISFIFGANWMYGIVVMLIISLLFCTFSYYCSKGMALKANGAKIITEAENPRLYRIVRDVAEKAGVPMPEVGIVNSNMANAFATGRNPKNAAVVATVGLLDLLPDDELEGVIAHEMSHVKNRDILVMSVASAMAVMISYVSRIAIFASLFNSNNKNGYMYLIALVASITVPIAAMLVQLGISRNREYLADKSGAEIINNPRALANALNHLENGNQTVYSYTLKDPNARSSPSPAEDYDFAHMWIASSPKKTGLMARMFSTHPPMEERIKRLNEMAEKMGL